MMAESGRRPAPGPAVWASLVFVVGAGLAGYLAWRGIRLIEANPQLQLPEIPLQTPLIYFFSAVVVIGIVLFLVPASKLKYVFRVLFAILFGWGAFVGVGLVWPSLIAAIVIASVAALAWLLWPRIWLHNLLLLVSLVSVGAVFGLLIAPWVVMIVLAVISVYDFVAVRFGYMMWMARRLGSSGALPAFVFPEKAAYWNLDLKSKALDRLLEGTAAEKEFSILGGGDVGFPLVLMVSVLSAFGAGGAAIVAGFSLLGLLGAYGMQRFLLKGRPVPALPPITVASAVGMVIVQFVL
jgi:presenilin-like A22 family membrane protease